MITVKTIDFVIDSSNTSIASKKKQQLRSPWRNPHAAQILAADRALESFVLKYNQDITSDD